MKVIVSTKYSQGNRKNDFCWVPDGELLMYGALECTGEEVDGFCGCARSLVGLECHKATTTFMVIELPYFTPNDLRERMVNTLKNGGWNVENKKDFLEENVKFFSNVNFDVGTVLERRENGIVPRIL